MDFELFLRAFAALVLVLGLIGLLAWMARRLGWTARVTRPRQGNQRLAVKDVLAVDARHRLVLISRDDVEHLILLGVDGSRVIETGIAPSESTEQPS